MRLWPAQKTVTELHYQVMDNSHGGIELRGFINFANSFQGFVIFERDAEPGTPRIIVTPRAATELVEVDEEAIEVPIGHIDGLCHYAKIVPNEFYDLRCRRYRVAPDNLAGGSVSTGGFRSSLGQYVYFFARPRMGWYCERARSPLRLRRLPKVLRRRGPTGADSMGPHRCARH